MIVIAKASLVCCALLLVCFQPAYAVLTRFGDTAKSGADERSFSVRAANGHIAVGYYWSDGSHPDSGTIVVYKESSPGAEDYEANAYRVYNPAGLSQTIVSGNTRCGFGEHVNMRSDARIITTGESACISGGAVPVGWIFYNTNPGDTDWVNNAVQVLPTYTATRFGHKSAVDGTTVVFADVNQHCISIYYESSDGSRDWTSNEVRQCSAGNYLGFAVAIDGVNVVANEWNRYIQVYSETSAGTNDWASNPTTISIMSDGDYRASIDISGRRIACGVQGGINTYTFVGAVFLYTESSLGARDWASYETKLVTSDGFVGDSFGVSVDLKGDTLVVAREEHAAIYVFQESTLYANDFATHSEIKLESERETWSAAFTNNVVVSVKNAGTSVTNPNVFLHTFCPTLLRYKPCDCESLTSTGVYCDEPCSNGGIANVNGTLDGFDLYGGCNCAGTGHIGPYCDTPCLNGGVNIDGFTCDCTNTGFIGDTCEIECMNGGLSDPTNDFTACDCTGTNTLGTQCETSCVNGIDDPSTAFTSCDCTGTNMVGNTCNKFCNNGVSDATFENCDCTLSGATGKFCTKDVDDCLSSPCMNGGFCTDFGADTFPNHANEYNCSCSAPYMGPTCEDTLCYSSPCLNSGTCVNGEDFVCNCADTGYEGELCQTETDECASSPCLNDGVCTDLLGTFSCDCTGSGYEGLTCSDDIDDCASDPCDNGSCKDKGANKFGCTCDAGFTGDMCETNIDDCASSPCGNAAVCVDDTLSFTCDCTDTGFEGTVCDQDIDDCASNPCEASATCIDGVSSYECNAPNDPCLSAPCGPDTACVTSSSTPDAYDCAPTVSTGIAGYNCIDAAIASVDCTDPVSVATYLAETLAQDLGGQPEDYHIQVTGSGDTYDVDIVYTDAAGTYVDDAAFAFAIAASGSIPTLVGSDSSSSSYTGTATMLSPFLSMLLLLMGILSLSIKA